MFFLFKIHSFQKNKSVGEVCVSYDLFKSRVENGLSLDLSLVGVSPWSWFLWDLIDWSLPRALESLISPLLQLLCMEEYYSEVRVEKCMAEKLSDWIFWLIWKLLSNAHFVQRCCRMFWTLDLGRWWINECRTLSKLSMGVKLMRNLLGCGLPPFLPCPKTTLKRLKVVLKRKNESFWAAALHVILIKSLQEFKPVSLLCCALTSCA